MRTLAFLLAGVGVGVAAYRLTRPADPIFEGRPLSVLLKGIRSDGISMGGANPVDGLNPPRLSGLRMDPTASRALSTVGTQALPRLVHMLRAKDSWLELRLHELPRLERLVFPDREWAFADQTRALAAFQEMGALAAPALTEILPLLDDPDTALVALVAILCIGPRTETEILAPTRVLAIPDSPSSELQLVRSSALFALASLGTPASNAAPAVTPFLSSTNHRLRTSAAIARIRFGSPSNDVLPMLLADLDPDPDPAPPIGPGKPPGMAFAAASRAQMEQRDRLLLSLYALGELGPHAGAALPQVEALATHHDPEIRRAAALTRTRIQATPP